MNKQTAHSVGKWAVCCSLCACAKLVDGKLTFIGSFWHPRVTMVGFVQQKTPLSAGLFVV